HARRSAGYVPLEPAAPAGRDAASCSEWPFGADVAEGVGRGRAWLPLRGTGCRTARPGLRAPHAGRQARGAPVAISRQEAGRAGLRQLYLRALPIPVRGPRRTA